MTEPLLIRQLGRLPYEPVWQAMKTFTDQRNADTPDELWVVEHEPVFTQGQAGKAEHVLAAGDIPVVKVDRGGQVTYHGPGQLVFYVLLDARRRGRGPRELVSALENSVIRLLAQQNVEGYANPNAPGVYVDGAKVAALGLRFRKGRSYHGLSLNVDMDLEPFRRVNPCGYVGQAVTMLASLYTGATMADTNKAMLDCLITELDYPAWKEAGRRLPV
ncbi:lipoyl(octanoyl) transferase LipB [Candidatus Sororendozoicomonas aggregata]|uniref:lipoyl(octanoyl) transferase LipB n=1 Tax=Candidatus Sororendozoicomonas aggregata TaxID=3073239 RepID=UPI002ED19C02